MFRRRFPSCLVGGLAVMAIASVAHAADYDTKTTFRKNMPVTFPDFTLTYLGERRVASERYPRGFLYYDFRIAGSSGTQTVSWTSGTGDIGPVEFRAGSGKYALELRRSDRLGPLKEDEVVVLRRP